MRLRHHPPICVLFKQYTTNSSHTLQTVRRVHDTGQPASWLVVNKLSDNSVSCEEITLTDYLNLVDANTLKMYLHRKSISVISE